MGKKINNVKSVSWSEDHCDVGYYKGFYGVCKRSCFKNSEMFPTALVTNEITAARTSKRSRGIKTCVSTSYPNRKSEKFSIGNVQYQIFHRIYSSQKQIENPGLEDFRSN